MSPMIKTITRITGMLIITAMPILNTAYASLASTVTIDFEAGDWLFFDGFGNPQEIQNIQLPSAVFDQGYYLEEGVEHRAIPFGGGAGGTTSHVHGFTNAATGNSTRQSEFSDDSGGGLFTLHDGGNFSLQTWEDEFIGDDITVRGYQSGGAFFDVTLDNAIYGSRTDSPDFMDLDSRFGNIVLVEYFFTSPGRGFAGAAGVNFLVDNIALGAPVPLPASIFLFMSGLFGMFGVARKRKINVAT